jgi:hypothetical protein
VDENDSESDESEDESLFKPRSITDEGKGGKK